MLQAAKAHVLSASIIAQQTSLSPSKQFGNPGDPNQRPASSRISRAALALGFRMEPEEAEAVLETIWDLHDKVSDAIHVLSRAHFLRTVRRRAGDRPAGVVHIKGFPVDGDEDADLNSVAEEVRSLHAIRAALEDLEDKFECFLAVHSLQEAEGDIALQRLQQSHIMLSIRLKEHHGKNREVIDQASNFINNVYHDIWPSPSVNKPERSRIYSSINTTKKRGKGSNFLGWIVSSSLDLARNSLNIKNIGGLLGNRAVLAVGMITMLQLHFLASGEQSLPCRKYSYRRINGGGNSSQFETSSLAVDSRTSHLDVFLAKS